MLLCMLQSVGVLGDQLWCSVCICQTDQFAHWHSCEVEVQAMGCASAALWYGQLRMHAWNSFEAHWPLTRGGWRTFLPSLPIISHFGGDISRVLAPWKIGKDLARHLH